MVLDNDSKDLNSSNIMMTYSNTLQPGPFQASKLSTPAGLESQIFTSQKENNQRILVRKINEVDEISTP